LGRFKSDEKSLSYKAKIAQPHTLSELLPPQNRLLISASLDENRHPRPFEKRARVSWQLAKLLLGDY
jgi:hypothetical protein